VVQSKVHEPGLISSHVISEVRFHKYYSNHSVFICRTSSDTAILVIYIDSILLTWSDVVSIEKAKEYLNTQFVTNNIGS